MELCAPGGSHQCPDTSAAVQAATEVPQSAGQRGVSPRSRASASSARCVRHPKPGDTPAATPVSSAVSAALPSEGGPSTGACEPASSPQPVANDIDIDVDSASVIWPPLPTPGAGSPPAAPPPDLEPTRWEGAASAASDGVTIGTGGLHEAAKLFRQPEVAAAVLKMQSKADEGRAATMTLNEACGGAPECVENLEAALKVHGAMFGSSDKTLIIRREVRHFKTI